MQDRSHDAPHNDDKVNILLLERGRGYSLVDGLEAGKVSEQQLMSLLFQSLYTLRALARRRVRHGDLHAGNVFVDLISTQDASIAYFCQGNRSPEYYEIPTLGMVAKIYDWDWGGVYFSEPPPRVAAWPMPTNEILNGMSCNTTNRPMYGACGASNKSDAFTLLTFLYHMDATRHMDTFRDFVTRSIDARLVDLAPHFQEYGGFAYRACQGVVRDVCPADPQSSILAARPRCKAPYDFPDCYMRSLDAILGDSAFAAFRHSIRERLPATEYVYGDWSSEREKKALQQLFRYDSEVPVRRRRMVETNDTTNDNTVGNTGKRKRR